MPNSNLSIYAKWTALKYNITFITGEVVLKTGLQWYNNEIVLPDPQPEMAGFVFNGWCKGENSTKDLNLTCVPSRDVVFYALFTSKPIRVCLR